MLSMTLKDKKRSLVSDIEAKVNTYDSFFFVDYHGLSVLDMHNLRGGIRKNNSFAKVYKNNLFKLALKKSFSPSDPQYKKIEKLLLGQVLYVFSNEEAFDVAKLLISFYKKKMIQIKGWYFEKQFFLIDDIKLIAQIPSRKELIMRLVYALTIKQRCLLTLLNNPLSSFTYLLSQVSKTKDQAK